MENILLSMQYEISEYIESLSGVIGVDIEVADKNLIRVAGTGRLKENINTDMTDEGLVYRRVLETGERVIVEQPTQDSICLDCAKRDICEETYDLAIPIIVFGHLVGVIGMVAFSLHQRERILNNHPEFIAFMERTARFIANRAMVSLRRYSDPSSFPEIDPAIMNKDQGMMLLSKNRMLEMNLQGYRILGLTDPLEGAQINVTRQADLEQGKYKYKIDFADTSHVIIGRELSFFLGFDDYIKIITFEAVYTSQPKQKHSIAISNNLKKLRGKSSAISGLRASVERIANSPSSVLITGESGTGKDLLASLIHESGNRADQPFIAVNCAGIPENLLESELFGYVRGAFSGADPRGRTGKLEAAGAGTLLLDEIGELPLFMQTKLLRVLENRTLERLGSNKPIKLKMRIIAATNSNLEQMVEAGKFRADLYFRLNVIPLQIPALRDRPQDIKVLWDYYMHKYSTEFGRQGIELDSKAQTELYAYSWPGNVRELINSVEYLVNLSPEDGLVEPAALPPQICQSKSNNSREICSLSSLEKEGINQALLHFGNDLAGKKQAASCLGISVSTLYRKMKTYNL